nr:TetR/AcrR family transcriptional regulator [Marinicella sp. W31]MDC2876028.1 TetR/AcrR family transcriptional regulator [Marinicella sp. W31]
MNTPPKRKSLAPEVRRNSILDAALAVFSEKGFANARIEDIARRAEIGKGTVYLYFPDKESLFKSLISDALGPLLMAASSTFEETDLSPRETLGIFFQLLKTEILATEKRDLVRLMVMEMRNFPDIAEFYHKNIIRSGLTLIVRVLEKAQKQGELRSVHVLKAPQVIFAPALLSVVWDANFARYGDLDLDAAFDFYLDTLFKPAEGKPHEAHSDRHHSALCRSWVRLFHFPACPEPWLAGLDRGGHALHRCRQYGATDTANGERRRYGRSRPNAVHP